MNNGKTVRVLTVCLDKDGVICGGGVGRPLTLASARTRAAKPVSFGSSLEIAQQRIIVRAECLVRNHDMICLIGQRPAAIDAWVVEAAPRVERP